MTNDQPLWTPTPERVADAGMTRFRNWLKEHRGLEFDGYKALHQWSIDQMEDFWIAFWEFADIIADTRGDRVLVEGERGGDRGFQSDQANSAHQVTNVWGRFTVDHSALPPPAVLDGPVLLVDDEAGSRWTIAVSTWQLTAAGAGPVLPFCLRTR